MSDRDTRLLPMDLRRAVLILDLETLLQTTDDVPNSIELVSEEGGDAVERLRTLRSRHQLNCALQVGAFNEMSLSPLSYRFGLNTLQAPPTDSRA